MTKTNVRLIARASVAKDIFSANVTSKGSWHDKKKSWYQAGVWQQLLRGECFLGLPKPQLVKQRIVIFTRPYGGRVKQMDKINFAQGCKPVLDALVRLGWLRDDTPDCVDDKYHQVHWPDSKNWPKEKNSTRRVRLMIGIYEVGEDQ